MSRRARTALRRGAIATVAAASLASAAPALGATIPDTLSSAPVSPGKATIWTFSWAGSTPEFGDPVTYQGGWVATAADTPAELVDSTDPTVSIAVPEGDGFFRVRSVEGATVSDFSTALAIKVDRTGPTVTGLALDGNAGVGTWYRSPLMIRLQGCTDAGVGAPCADQTWTEEGNFAVNARSITLADNLNNTSTIPIPLAFGFDKTKPRTDGGVPFGTPTIAADEPTFEWTPGKDANPTVASGIDRYQLVFSTADNFSDEYTFSGGEVIANRDDTGQQTNYTANRDPQLRAIPLPDFTPLKWWVRTIDNAGNIRLSTPQDLTIDPTVPAAPTITGGPNAPTRDSSPTFTWEGDQTNFRWDVTLLGAQQPARQGGGPNVTQATLASLADGDYSFRVIQLTPAGKGSAEAIRSFKVDTTAPNAPTILTRPTFPAIGSAPVFTWETEPGAFSRWSILNAAGALVTGPVDTPVNSAELPSLAEGSYTFQVAQIDPAGNVSATTSEGFTTLAPLVVAPSPTLTPRAALLAALPKQNALRLQPKAGQTLPTLRPVLRWKKGPNGTKLYNLQIFRVTPGKNLAKPKVTKILSRFPRGRTFRPAVKNLVAGTCYVWRVWPYTGTAFTTRPVGVSNFCIASKQVIRKATLKGRSRR